MDGGVLETINIEHLTFKREINRNLTEKKTFKSIEFKMNHDFAYVYSSSSDMVNGIY